MFHFRAHAQLVLSPPFTLRNYAFAPKTEQRRRDEEEIGRKIKARTRKEEVIERARGNEMFLEREREPDE